MSAMNLHQSQSHEVLRSWQSQRTDVNHTNDFVLPLFVGNDDDSIEAIESMPGVYRYGSNRAIEYLEPLVNSYGLRAILLFPVITKSDQAKLEATEDDQVDDEDARDILSSASESNSSASSSSSSSSRSSRDGRMGQTSIMPERLLPEDEADELSDLTGNPFLRLVTAGNKRNPSDKAGNSGNKFDLDREKGSRKESGKMSSSQTTRSRDVRLIRGLALKDENNPVLRLIPRLRAKFPQLLIICDVCLCTFTSTGHCCLFEQAPMRTPAQVYHAQSAATPLGSTIKANHQHQHQLQAPISITANHCPISNQITCQYLALLALEYAMRGCNVVAPSDMMDGRIQTIREKLNENHLYHVSILSYSAKFASSFYGPFRQATMNAPEFGDRRAYQLPPGSRAMALKAVERDIQQGADFVMVKPGAPYLDIVRDLREAHPNVPIAVYQVSGEYSMLKIAANANILDLKLALNEMLTAYRRAGATIIISYFTPEILRGEL